MRPNRSIMSDLLWYTPKRCGQHHLLISVKDQFVTSFGKDHVTDPYGVTVDSDGFDVC